MSSRPPGHAPKPRQAADFARTAKLAGAVAGAVAVIAGAVVLALPVFADREASTGNPFERARPPDVVLIVTDDQRFDTMSRMPIVQEKLGKHGITFANAFVTNPICCPSRATILTGQYSHSTGVYANAGRYGGFPNFYEASTLATWLDEDFDTGLFGKYLNGYKTAGGKGFIPLGWDKWISTIANGIYYNYDMNFDGTVRHFGRDPEDYSTRVLADQAVSFIKGTKDPVFVYFTPPVPHGPADPEYQDRNEFATIPRWFPPSYNEEDISDKPQWLKDYPQLHGPSENYIQEFRVNQLRTLQSMDRGVGRIVDALAETGRLDNTLIIFTSDNGYMWGEHRLMGKGVAYEEAIRVPLIVRYDPLIEGPRTDDHIVVNVDLAPTIAELAGVPAPEAEGDSLVRLFENSKAPWRKDFLLEHWSPGRNSDPPTFCGVRGQRYKYVDYSYGTDELYDLQRDPDELENLINDPAMRQIRDQMRRRTLELCHPKPPKTPRPVPTG
ncbi:MAG: sulfatase [Actinomycetota bacterium]